MTRKRKPAALLHAADGHQALLEKVAAEYGVESDSDKADHIATLIVLRKAIRDRAWAGDPLRTDPDDFVKLAEELRQYQPVSKAPVFELRSVEGVIGIYTCKHCHERNELEQGEYTPAGALRPFKFKCECGRAMSFSDKPGENSRLVADDGSLQPIEPEPEPETVTYREGIGSAFHAQVLPKTTEIPPLKRDQPAIGASHAGTSVVDLWRNDPNPTRKVSVQ